MTRILCVGIAVLDYVYRVEAIPTQAEKHRAKDLAIVGGGIAANASAAIARLGGQAMMATRIGDDLTGQEIKAGLERDGVECTHVRTFPGKRSPVSAIFVDEAGERLIMTYTDPEMPRDTGWLPSVLPNGINAVLGDTRWDDGSEHLFHLARKAGVPAVLDGDRKPLNERVFQLATHVAYSAQGVRELTGLADPCEGLMALQKTAQNWIAVTVGVDGVYFFENGALTHEPAFTVDVVDTLGAGDVWHGGFALALAEGGSEREAIRFASAVSAIKCTRFGGRLGTPTRAEVAAFLQQRG